MAKLNITAKKELSNALVTIEPAATYTPKSMIIGNPDSFELLHEDALPERYIKRTLAMDVGVGCVVKSVTTNVNDNGDCSTSESMLFVPGVKIKPDVNGGKRLVAKS